MKTPTLLRFTTREKAFLASSLVVLVAGIWFCASPERTKWVPGLGAIVIVLGIVFAMSDLSAVLQMQADKWAKVRKEFVVQNRIDELEEEAHEVLSEEERREVRRKLEAHADKQLPSSAPAIRKRFRFVEVFIVCIGTLVNGFGQPLLELLMATTCAPR